jgi:thiamine-phosphate pyrophosphorylase
MDQRLLAWGRAVKRRQGARLPVLWLFTDARRLPDPLPSIAMLPRGLCGVVFRHDDWPDRAALGAQVARLCRARRLGLVVAGDARLAAQLGAGVHLRGGRRSGLARMRPGLLTSSAHTMLETRRACRAGARILFISPAFASASHAGESGLGALRWARLARQIGDAKAYALGGVDGQKITALATFCCGAGAIHALEAGISQ